MFDTNPYNGCAARKISYATFRSPLAPYGIVEKSDDQKTIQNIIYKKNVANFQVTECQFTDKKFNVRMTITEVDGVGDMINNDLCWEPIVAHINDLFVDYYNQEKENVRSLCVDRRIHACLYFIESHGEAPKLLDIAIMKEISQYCNVIPVVSKSDILIETEINEIFEKICVKLESENIHIFEPARDLNENIVKAPYFIICGKNDKNTQTDVRSSMFGEVEIENNEDNDFNEVKRVLIEKHMIDLIESTETFYESFRTKELTNDFVTDAKLSEDEMKISKDFIERLKEEERGIRIAREKYFARKVELELQIKEQEMQSANREH
ncbi:hypothetical protein COBT_002632 [Conglomerata obtusa]